MTALRSGRKTKRALRKFRKQWGQYSGSDRGEAETEAEAKAKEKAKAEAYLDELIGCYGANRRSAGARFQTSRFEHGITDMYWPGVCVVEMAAPSQAVELLDQRKQRLEYWHSQDDPRFVVLCTFQQFEVWERGRLRFGERPGFALAELPDNYEKLIFLAGTDQTSRKSLFLKLAAVVVALAVCVVGIVLLWGVWDGPPVAAAFTRVGGATPVETALEASRFWLTPPQYVVETRDNAGQLMLRAAQCAVAHDAPLLFTSLDPRLQRLVDARINEWRTIEPPAGVARLELTTIRSQRDLWPPIELPTVITIRTRGQAERCRGKIPRADVARLSTLEVANPLTRLPQIPRQPTLAPVVIFAAAIEPGDQPDVAVGLALAAHIVKVNREQVSLVVIPHYLESDHELESKLQGQHELVTGGVVLGQTPTVPEETRTLLRQLLTARDGHGLLAQMQGELGSVGSLIAALLALVGLGTVAGIAAPMAIERFERNEKIKQIERLESISSGIPPEEKTMGASENSENGPASVPQKESDWLSALGRDRNVTVWLRSGRRVTGTVEGQFPVNDSEAKVFRIKDASVVLNDARAPEESSPSRSEGKLVLVSVADIELIEINASKE